MSPFLRIFLLTITFGFVTACASDPRVQSSYDDNLDFSQFETYNFGNRTEIEDPDLSDTLELVFTAAVEQQMLLRGLVKSDKPDVLINVSVDAEDVSRAPAKPQNGNCPRYGDYNSRYSADPYAGEGKRPMCIYTEGSIKVIMVDVESSHTIWEGISRVRLDEGDRGARLVRNVQNDVAIMFGESPARNLQRPSGMFSTL